MMASGPINGQEIAYYPWNVGNPNKARSRERKHAGGESRESREQRKSRESREQRKNEERQAAGTGNGIVNL
ncbi:unnamed protein product [Cylicostephanus goldi]|uniref:Uncharacterized protein n=1 Tax=Cylicostephanus goldi TaxID=71465 RepID=A0A3P6QSQ8_CYLGO|nr:unnamed protein product [Cylicostephanus goldi]